LTLFEDVNGYHGISKQASGDDVMLMNRVAKKNKESLFFIKSQYATLS